MTTLQSVSQRSRRVTVIVYALSIVLMCFVLLLVNYEKPSPLSWAMLVGCALPGAWSGQRLRSAAWGFHRWHSNPASLDEREKIRSLEAVALAYRFYAAALLVLGAPLLSLQNSTMGLPRVILVALFMFAMGMNTVPTAILAWNEPDEIE